MDNQDINTLIFIFIFGSIAMLFIVGTNYLLENQLTVAEVIENAWGRFCKWADRVME